MSVEKKQTTPLTAGGEVKQVVGASLSQKAKREAARSKKLQTAGVARSGQQQPAAGDSPSPRGTGKLQQGSDEDEEGSDGLAAAASASDAECARALASSTSLSA